MKLCEKGLELYKKRASLELIAKKCRVQLRTVRRWIKRYDWNSQIDYAPPTWPVKGGAPKGNTNSKGGKKGNKKALKHGLYAKCLPPETLSIVEGLDGVSPLDILWVNIKIKFATILHAQKIMHVKSATDHLKLTESATAVKVNADGTKEVKKESRERIVDASAKEVSFLIAQSRAMGTLNNMIRTYDELCRSSLATEEQKARILKLKAEVAVLADSGDSVNEGVQIIDDTN